MYVYALIDNRELDRYDKMQLFYSQLDAEEMRNSFKEERSYYHVDRIKVLA